MDANKDVVLIAGLGLSVAKLLDKSTEATEAHVAMQFAQAALNAAHAL